jgi:WXXGXW repeat (2 copies)
MRCNRLLSAVLSVGAAMSALPAIGCYATTDAYVAYDEPPAAREEVVVYRPGFFFVHGRWMRDGDHWAWRSGYYERERPGYIYAEGRWERRGNHFLWIEGGWRARSGVVVRDHRY